MEMISPSRTSDGKAVFLRLSALYLLIIYPIIRANRYYADDLARALLGYAGWNQNGRGLANFLMKILVLNSSQLVDISPISQLAGLALLAWAGVLIAKRFNIASPWLAALVSFPLGAQPFFLENLSFKFDAAGMCLAVFLAVVPITVLKDGRLTRWRFGLGILSLFGCLSSYQAAINVFLVFVVLELLLAQLEDAKLRDIARLLGFRVAQLAITILLYKLLVQIRDWVASGLVMIHSLRDIGVVKANLLHFALLAGKGFNERWSFVYVPFLVLSALIAVGIGLRYAVRMGRQHSRWAGVALTIVSLLMPVAALLCIVGPMMLLVNPELSPRVMVGVGGFLSAMLILIQAAVRRWQWSNRWSLVIAGIWAFGMIAFASIYGNAQAEQKNYEEQIASHLADDIAQLKVRQPIDSFLIEGSTGLSPEAEHAANVFPLIRKLVPVYLAGQDYFNTSNLLAFYVHGTTDLYYESIRGESEPSREQAVQQVASITSRFRQAPVVRASGTYAMCVVDKTAVVVLLPANEQGRVSPGQTCGG